MSNYHEGEILMQAQFGMAEQMAKVGEVVLRTFMPEQHREFFPLLPYLLVGSVDEDLKPHASVLTGPEGFVMSDTPESLVINALPLADDVLSKNLQLHRPLGLLGLQAHTKRRNRMNGLIAQKNADGFRVQVQQSFGNCPKYIVPRELRYAKRDGLILKFQQNFLSPQHIQWIKQSDTFFLASAHPKALSPTHRNQGVDISHRAGPEGFIQVDANRLSFPDYRGNYFFNSFGNLRLNPKACLLFLDYEWGHVMTLDVVTHFRDASPDEQALGIQLWVDCEIKNMSVLTHSLNLVLLN